MRKEPVISFTKEPKTLSGLKNTSDDTYDIKKYGIGDLVKLFWHIMISSMMEGRV
jgi:hypothetical protein